MLCLGGQEGQNFPDIAGADIWFASDAITEKL
ncbi:hypothetical protein BCCR75502_07047 [Burkholderia sola]|nr:hypothetical protein BCCR75388_07020 [Burkholderia cenocepacia]CAG2379711.1 hypothetical protein BCCR75389_07013 [Burkholderia cenocepacia]CAG2379845.1 hypothetical protein BCCR12632_07051 [Burkholderia cenocepacia]CAG2379915.1 hypothetical protein BCCR75384_07047 [Burkholderia cenocepacia]CAG2379996.1 hypothetical protein BCCR75387_07043 [Burkholderia cenocepacia]